MAQYFKERVGIFGSVDCANWHDFRYKIQALSEEASGKNTPEEGRFIFRGQGCSSWGLETSFDRKFSHLGLADRQRRYAKLIQDFRENAHIYAHISGSSQFGDLSDLKEKSDDIVGALAQHFGLSTRLLDWSKSPYVAAFFAFSSSSECKSGMRSIWALDTKLLDILGEEHVLYVSGQYDKNKRLIWQLGCFTMNKSSDPDFLELCRNGYKKLVAEDFQAEPLLVRFDMQSSEALTVLNDLNMMRINSMTIFPGMEGFIRWLEEGGSSL